MSRDAADKIWEGPFFYAMQAQGGSFGSVSCVSTGGRDDDVRIVLAWLDEKLPGTSQRPLKG
jgi:hypothetical protein